MFSKIKIKYKKSLLLQHVLWTFFIAFVYLLGLAIPLGTVPLNTALFKDAGLAKVMAALASVSGGQYASAKLFTLGIGPYMTTLILWRGLTIFKVPGMDSLTMKGSQRLQNTLMVVIAVIQAFGLTASLDYVGISATGFYTANVARAVTIAILVSGSIILNWLGQINAKYGIGGPTVIIIVNMVLSMGQTVGQGVAMLAKMPVLSALLASLLVLTSVLVLIYVMAIINRAEYRIPITRISINNEFSKDTYLPIRMMPAGGMPFMYGMTLMVLPTLIFQGLASIYSKNTIITFLAANTSINTLTGAILYTLMMYLLSVGFAYFNYDSQEIAKNFRENGDYIATIRPGRDTQNYIQRQVRIFAHIGAVITCILGGVPAIVNVGNDNGISLAMLISSLFIVTTLMFPTLDQIKTLRSWKQYDKLL